MKKFLIVTIVAAMLAVMLSVASASYFSYCMDSVQLLYSKKNHTNSAQTITYNTRPSTGQGGVHIGIYRYEDGAYIYESGKQFPYFQNVPAMTSNMPALQWRYFLGYPIIDGQVVEGNVTFSTSY